MVFKPRLVVAKVLAAAFLMLFHPAVAAAQPCYPNLPNPELVVVGAENYVANGQAWTRFLLNVTNSAAFPDALFVAAPSLPACGLNTNSSRTWVDIYDNLNSRIYGFCGLQRSQDLNSTWFAIASGASRPVSVSIRMTDRQCGLTYASNQAATSCGQVPQAPSGLGVQVVDRVAILTWSAVAVGCPVSSFLLDAGTSAGSNSLGSFNLGSAATSLTSPPLGDGTYFVRIRAANAWGASGPSNEVSFTVGPPPVQTPGPPLSFVASVLGSTVTLSWAPPQVGGTPTAYGIEAGTAAGLADLGTLHLAASQTSFVASGVPAGRYFVRLRAMNAAGASPPSNEVVVLVGLAPRITRIPLPTGVAGTRGGRLSRDGSTVVTTTWTSVPVPSAWAWPSGVLVHDLRSGQQSYANVPGFSLADFDLSRNGGRIAIRGAADGSNFSLYLWTPATGAVRQSPPTGLIGDFLYAASADLRYVLLRYSLGAEVVILDTVTWLRTHIARPSNGVDPPDGDSGLSDISADGRFVVFESSASNLVPQ